MPELIIHVWKSKSKANQLPYKVQRKQAQPKYNKESFSNKFFQKSKQILQIINKKKKSKFKK